MIEVLELRMGEYLPGTKVRALVTDELVVGGMYAYNGSHGWWVQSNWISPFTHDDGTDKMRMILMFINDTHTESNKT